MKIITRHELRQYTLSELRGAYRATFNALVQAKAGSPERRNALASLETICNELYSRYP